MWYDHDTIFLVLKSLKSLKLFKRIYFSDNKFEKDEARAYNNLLLPQTSKDLSKDMLSTLQSRYVLETMSLVV